MAQVNFDEASPKYLLKRRWSKGLVCLKCKNKIYEFGQTLINHRGRYTLLLKLIGCSSGVMIEDVGGVYETMVE